MDKQALADLWRDSAQLIRAEIFGSDDVLLPQYIDIDGELARQARTPAVGMVGPNYHGTLAILSVNGAGGKADHRSIPSSDRMYVALRNLQASQHGESAFAAFNELNKAVMASMPDWGVSQQHTKKILNAAKHRLSDIAYLYLIPFRTRGDDSSKIRKPFQVAGYDHHLVHQLRTLQPEMIIAIDRPSEQAALRFQLESPQTNVIYYTRQRDAHDARKKTLAEITRVFEGTT